MKPLYLHDCIRCVYLGQAEEYDLYFCDQNGSCPTVIARWGNDGPNYTSGLHSSTPALIEAEIRALEMMAAA